MKYMIIKSVVSLSYKERGNGDVLMRYEDARAGQAQDPDTFAIVNRLNAVLDPEGTFFIL